MELIPLGVFTKHLHSYEHDITNFILYPVKRIWASTIHSHFLSIYKERVWIRSPKQVRFFELDFPQQGLIPFSHCRTTKRIYEITYSLVVFHIDVVGCGSVLMCGGFNDVVVIESILIHCFLV